MGLVVSRWLQSVQLFAGQPAVSEAGCMPLMYSFWPDGHYSLCSWNDLTKPVHRLCAVFSQVRKWVCLGDLWDGVSWHTWWVQLATESLQNSVALEMNCAVWEVRSCVASPPAVCVIGDQLKVTFSRREFVKSKWFWRGGGWELLAHGSAVSSCLPLLYWLGCCFLPLLLGEFCYTGLYLFLATLYLFLWPCTCLLWDDGAE